MSKNYGTCHKKLYEICELSVLVIRSFSAASSRISTESSKGVRRIVKGCPQNHQRVSAESSKGVRRFVEGQSAQSQSSKACAESYCISTIVEG